MNRTLSLASGALLLHYAATAGADFYDSDDELIEHLIANDPVLSRVEGECRDNRVERRSEAGLVWFTLTARCPAPPPEDDCAAYRVTAVGTVDTASWATIRDLRFELLCSDGPGTAAELGDSFEGPFDVATALTLVYGRVPWNEAFNRGFNTLPNGRDFIEPLFDEAYVEDGIDKHVVIATLLPRPQSQHNCHACSPMLGGAVFRRDGERWQLEAVGREIEEGHAWFDDKHGGLSLIRIGPERFGLLHRNDDVGGGYEHRRRSLIFDLGGELRAGFVYRMPETGDTPGPGACPVPEIGLELSILDEDPPGDAGLFDVMIDASWNDARCAVVELDGGPGQGLTASGESCRRRARYRFEDGEYRLLATELDSCTPIEERTVPLRG